MWLLLGLRRIGYPDNFKVSGSRSLSDGSIILLSLSGSGVLGYPGVGYPSKNCFDSDCDVDPDPSFREIMKDVEFFGNTVLSVLTLVLHTSRTAFGCTNRNRGYPAIYIHFALIFSELYDF
ncbi:hypothetical protein F2Q68_00014323 [Brassica cretica]|uniref:Uncharacterized protein n=1 Tax=Brassica cretica TaxID=69181 RepID=A0A8S9HI93_BRACR|nr:hypothetical protein F2Q68_00014323 [Brassica cretica]